MFGLPDDKKKLLASFGTRLEALIYQRYRSKDQFLAASGFYKANLHGIITGKSDPQLSTLYRLARSLNLTLGELLQALEAEVEAEMAAAMEPAPLPELAHEALPLTSGRPPSL